MRIFETTSLTDLDNNKRRFLAFGTDSIHEVRGQLPAIHSVESEMLPGLSVYSITIQATVDGMWKAELEYR